MNEEMEKMGVIAIELIEEFFSNHFSKGLYAIYATKPTIHLVEVMQVDESKRTSTTVFEELNKYKNYKYNGIAVLTMRVSTTEYEYYLRLFENGKSIK